jgi:hypothetical protein
LDINELPNGGGSYTGTRPNSTYGLITEEMADAYANYNGLAVELKKNMGAGLSYKLAYTWSKSMDDASAGAYYYPTDESNPDADYGPSDFDTRSIFAGNVVYELPFGHSKVFATCSTGVLCKAISGWQVSSIFSANSGRVIA